MANYTATLNLISKVLDFIQSGGPSVTVLSLSQKSRLVKEPGWVYLRGNFGIWDMKMPLREMGREQMWMLPPTLDELFRWIIRRDSLPSL